MEAGAVPDPVSGGTAGDRNALPVEVDATAFEETYVQVPLERLRDPRITRLTGLIDELLANYERGTGRPPANVDDIRAALEVVVEIPEEARQRRHDAAMAAAHRGFHRGCGR
ncbi:hypothetical protein [Streptomyces fumanus]|uniref:hypothetical protein n=1 Tax=Streptomyces fumanus TaxID=67302 RepID=UPI003F4D51A2